ncbi:hypothetical protein B1J94_12860 [Leptospira kirschneri serovar Grippotyphosa]|nr:hypothetical protein B1J94_12860 [Leptospira kirschneri serovar Grippotyphosa]
MNFYFLNCGSSYRLRLFYLFCDFKSYFSEQNFAIVPTFKESIYKVQIPIFFRIIVFLHRIQVR